MNIKREIDLQQRCPCGLADCEIYRQTPLLFKANIEDTFGIAKTVNTDGRRGIEPLYALLQPVHRYIEKEKVIEKLVKMNEQCTECRKKHPIDKRDKMFRPVRIRINFVALSCAEEIYGFCVQNHLINPGR